ncbi:uncharacterized protein LOC130962584 [Arachis stenosperma]|uniref:uncharacterized protein LOC130962584 n=1 Tax=Arachis stenosperma TaxID=217475 RepID=UPI0025ABF17A|nr:uncharacterized protein LOC130962584 [Arachis stenosperma]
MPGIDPDLMSYKLAVYPGSRPIQQKRKKLGPERTQVVKEQVQALLEAGFIRKVNYPLWLVNVVLVKKQNRKWRMCVKYTDLNKACPNDPYLLPSIDALVDSASGYRYLSFMDAYSRYNQISMHKLDQEKTLFITPKGNYCYVVMPFGLKNARVTNQRLMNNVFSSNLGKLMEVYVDDMHVKTKVDSTLLSDLLEAFSTIRKHEMRFTHKGPYQSTNETHFTKDGPSRTDAAMSCGIVQKAIKSQYLTDFVAKYIESQESPTTWNLYIDGSSNKVDSGAGVILESEQGTHIELSLRFEFPTSNNQAEYEALLTGLKLAKKVGKKRLIVFNDSQVLTLHIDNTYQAKDPNIKKYSDEA